MSTGNTLSRLTYLKGQKRFTLLPGVLFKETPLSSTGRKLKRQPSLLPQPTTRTPTYFTRCQALHGDGMHRRYHSSKPARQRRRARPAGRGGSEGLRGLRGAPRGAGSGSEISPPQPAGRPQPGPRHRERFTLSTLKLRTNPWQELLSGHRAVGAAGGMTAAAAPAPLLSIRLSCSAR